MSIQVWPVKPDKYDNDNMHDCDDGGKEDVADLIDEGTDCFIFEYDCNWLEKFSSKCRSKKFASWLRERIAEARAGDHKYLSLSFWY